MQGPERSASPSAQGGSFVEREEWQHREDGWRPGPAALARETAVALQYNGIAHAVMLATPADLEDFALGFSLGEGILAQAGELYGVEIHPETAGITLELEISAEAFAGLKQRRRNLAGRTGCGLCGTESLDQVLRPLPDLRQVPGRLEAQALRRAADELPARQLLQSRTGGVHGAAWCAPDGSIELVREDVGRHNALDKLVGALARDRGAASPGAGFLLITSRASVEMVQKAATAGIAILAAVSAPTSLALEVAERSGLTLVGFARGSRFSVYTQRQRVAGCP